MIYLMALVLGAIYSLGFAPFDLWGLTLLAMGGLYYLLQHPGLRDKHRKAGLVAWVFGLGQYGVGASWVYVSIHVYGNAPPPLALFMVVLFVAVLALLFVLPLGWCFSRLQLPRGSWSSVFVFVALWVLLDWMSTWLFTGFPWLLPGYAGLDTPIASFAPLVGVLGTGLLLCLSATALAAMLVNRRFQISFAGLSLLPWLLGFALAPVNWVKPESQYSVALVQGNIDQAVKWQPDQAVPNVRKHLELSAQHWDADILIWPEAAITLYPQQAQGLLEDLTRQGEATQTDMIAGIPGVEMVGEGQYEFQNLAIGLGQARGRFAKQHLVPFGEYVPMEGLLRGLIDFFDLPMSRSSPGSSNQPNLQLSMGAAAMAICYEIAYPASMRQRARDAAVLITISNDTWFGASIGPLQHMQIARMRALENGRWLLRATNNGVTAIVAPDGTLQGQLPQFEAGVLRGSIHVMSGTTPFKILGHWPSLAYALGVLSVVLLRRWRKSASTTTSPPLSGS
ncbi:MAG: apolipoprotein N-acyltransferase [Pseudomonadaceae bacterium]|nr:apolipoprotein N-acyltransferase [Pseudomonadaceae bacterium]